MKNFGCGGCKYSLWKGICCVTITTSERSSVAIVQIKNNTFFCNN
jgi:hypothetical protein